MTDRRKQVPPRGRDERGTGSMTMRSIKVGAPPARFDRFTAMGARFVDGDDLEGAAGQGAPPADVQQHQEPQQEPAAPLAAGEKPKLNEHGYPDDTPLMEMTAGQREAYWKHHARQHEETWKKVRERNLTPEQIIEMQKRLNEIDRDKLTEHEKAVADARTEGDKEATARLAPALVRAKIETAVARRDPSLNDEAVAAKVEFLDLSRFLTDTGDVDAGKVATWAENNVPAPASNGAGQNGRKFPDMGGGKRGPVHETAQARADAYARKRGWAAGK